MVFSPKQRKLRIASFSLAIFLLILLFIGWRFVNPELGKLYIIYWSFCIIFALLLILIALEEMREISRYYLSKRKEIIHKTLGKDGRHKR
ncbi:hypothetical protein H5T88_01900 [bacterium]|nr:hypothetical protein [bacterium]